MPIHDYRCRACGAEFETLVRGGASPACPQCGATALERLLSLTAPQGTSGKRLATARQAAAREGHFSHYSRAERKKLG
ncbi:MAG TPA: zinc ribbon domain-containing protein [Albitalea sp.]